MSSGWDFGGQPPASGLPTVTLLTGSTFCVSDTQGGITSDAALGLFVRDTRVVSHWQVSILGERLDPLDVQHVDAARCVFLSRQAPLSGDVATTLVVSERRTVDDGMRAQLAIRNTGLEAVHTVLTLQVAADCADLFDVKAGRGRPRPLRPQVATSTQTMRTAAGGGSRGVRITATGDPITLPGQFLWELRLAPRARAVFDVDVVPLIDGIEQAPGAQLDDEQWSTAALVERRGRGGLITTPDTALIRTVARSAADVRSLQITDPSHPDRPVIAAGAPWFMTLFGRDSLISSWMFLPFDQRLARGTLAALADQQGTRTDPRTEEEPGRILHEVRFGLASSLTLGGGTGYYGTADATPLFVMLVGELARWGAPESALAELLPHVDRALDWIAGPGDPDGDGFVEYRRATDTGLLHQGWKDSWDGVNFRDGSLAQPPIALCEVQAYVYGAYRARAVLARAFGDDAGERRWLERAATLRDSFTRAFWLPHLGWYAVGLDERKRPIDACASNMAHALWTGIVDDEFAPRVADVLLDEAMFTGWGIRTLASTMPRYNPVSYHNGSVWPHDTAIAAAGLMRYGFTDSAVRVVQALLESATHFEGRLPELFCGFGRAEFPYPVAYPTACSPQAWAAAAPLLLVRTLLDLHPDLPRGRVRLAPAVAERQLPLTVSSVMLAGERRTISVTGDGCRFDPPLPDWLDLRVGQPLPTVDTDGHRRRASGQR